MGRHKAGAPARRSRKQTKAKVNGSTVRAKASTQAQISYEAMAESGLCYLGGKKYSITLGLSDINYQLAPPDVQEGIVEKYAQFLNGHLSDHHVQITVLNRVLDKERLSSKAAISLRGDGFDNMRSEYNSLITRRLSTGRNNTVTEKYLTLTAQAEDVEEAKVTLSRMAAEDSAALREVGGCKAVELDGQARVRLLQSMLRPNIEPDFTYGDLVGNRTITKDHVVPWEINTMRPERVELFSDGQRTLWQTMILRKMPAWMSDRVLADLADIPLDLAVSIHFDPLDQAEGLDLVKSQIAGMDIQRSNEQRKLAKQGLAEDLMPHELGAAHAEAVELRTQLEQSNEKLFTTRIVIGVAGKNEEELTDAVKRVRRACGKHSATLEDLRYMQLDALNALLPLGVCKIPVFRTLTTAVGAVMVPFTTQELLETSGNFYGVNALSKNLILADRRRGMNANAFILGTTGSGKSQLAKFDMVQTFLRATNDEVLIIDPEREYATLAKELGAARVVISAGSRDAINPLDLDKTVRTTDGDPVREKCSYVLSLVEVLLGGAEGLSPVKRSIVDRVTQSLYAAYWRDPAALAPTLRDLYVALGQESELEARELATGLELYAKGSSAGFARQTNVDTSARVTVYDIADLGRDLQTFGMMVVLEEIWARIARNKARAVRTWLYIDEFHLLFSNDFAASYCQAIFKRVRKWGASATGITQNIEELLANERARLMLSNSDGLFLLNQQSTDADALTELLKLSAQQRSYFTNVKAGCGLMKMGSAIIPFDNTMDPDSQIFRLFSTSFDEAQEPSEMNINVG